MHPVYLQFTTGSDFGHTHNFRVYLSATDYYRNNLFVNMMRMANDDKYFLLFWFYYYTYFLV